MKWRVAGIYGALVAFYAVAFGLLWCFARGFFWFYGAGLVLCLLGWASAWLVRRYLPRLASFGVSPPDDDPYLGHEDGGPT